MARTFPEIRAFVLALAVSATGCSGLAPTQDSTPDLSGVWARIVTPGMRPYYLGAFQEAEPPMTAWGEAKYQETRPSFGPRGVPIEQTNDPVYKGCAPPGLPRVYLHPFPMQIVNVPGREVIVLYEYDHLVRHLYTDGRPHDTSLGPTWIGSSIGHWEGDTLVVDTIGLSDLTWLDRFGHPHSEELHLVERFRRVGSKTLQIDVTIDDPKAYAQPWSFQLRYEPRPPEWRMLEVVCEDDASFIDFEKAASAPPR